jgi:hypothetical protein
MSLHELRNAFKTAPLADLAIAMQQLENKRLVVPFFGCWRLMVYVCEFSFECSNGA